MYTATAQAFDNIALAIVSQGNTSYGPNFPDFCTKGRQMYIPPQVSPPAPDQIWISLLAHKGRLEAIKRGRVWLTTSQVVSDYQKSVEKVS